MSIGIEAALRATKGVKLFEDANVPQRLASLYTETKAIELLLQPPFDTDVVTPTLLIESLTYTEAIPSNRHLSLALARHYHETMFRGLNGFISPTTPLGLFTIARFNKLARNQDTELADLFRRIPIGRRQAYSLALNSIDTHLKRLKHNAGLSYSDVTVGDVLSLTLDRKHPIKGVNQENLLFFQTAFSQNPPGVENF